MADTHIPPHFGIRVCAGLDALNYTPELERFFKSWIQAEGGTAKWNALNSTLWVQNYTQLPDYNSIGVRNYISANAGVAATVLTLSKREADGTLRYGNIVNECQNNYRNGRSAEAIVHNCWDEIQMWGTSPQLMLDILRGLS